jgi:hypothetical protein
VGASSNSAAQWWSVPAMACRRVSLSKIEAQVPVVVKPPDGNTGVDGTSGKVVPQEQRQKQIQVLQQLNHHLI